MVTAMIPTFDENDYDTPQTTIETHNRLGQESGMGVVGKGKSSQVMGGGGGGKNNNNKIGIGLRRKQQQQQQQQQVQPQTIESAPPSIIYLMSVLSAMGGFLFGYDTGIVSGAMVFVRKSFELNNFWQELVVSITVLGAWIFSLVAGSLSESYGRKIIILVASVVFTAGSLIMGFAWSKWVLLFGRLTVGIAIGLASTVVPMYIAEVAPPNIRGSLVTLNNCFICFGQLCAAITAGAFSYDKLNGWRWMLSLAAVPAALQFLGFMFMPESPRWLIKRRRDEEAIEALMKIRGPKNPGIKREFDMIKVNSDEAESQKARRKEQKRNIIMSILRKTATRRALIVGCLLQAIQQLAGINTLMYYNATIIEMSGVNSPSTAVWLAVPTAAVYMLFSMTGYFLADRVGRRTLTLGSLLGVVVALLVLGTGFQLTSLNGAAVQMHNMSGHEPCNSYQTCYECVANSRCGFCYDPHDLAQTSLCLLRDAEDHSVSIGGACSQIGDNSSLVFANQICPSNSQGISINTWLVLGGLILYLAAFAPGMAPMPWTINSEIYPMWARGVCYSMATSVNWLFNMIISLTFLTLTEALTTHGTFYMYSIIASIGWLLLFWKLPETRGRSLEEVSSLFARQQPDNEEIMEDGSDQGGSQSSQGGTVIRPARSTHNVVGMENLGFSSNEEPTRITQQQTSRSFKIQSPLSKVATHAMKTGAIPKLNSISSNNNNNNINNNNIEDADTQLAAAIATTRKTHHNNNSNDSSSQSGSPPSINYQARRYSNGRHPQAYLASTLSTSPDGASKVSGGLSGDDDGVVAYMHRRKTNNNNRQCNNKQTIQITKSSPLPQQHYIIPTNHSTNTTTIKLTNHNNKIINSIITNTNDSTNDDRSSSLSHLINYNDYYTSLDDTNDCSDDMNREDYGGQLFVTNNSSRSSMLSSSNQHLSNSTTRNEPYLVHSRQQQKNPQSKLNEKKQLDDLYLNTNNSPPKTSSSDKISITSYSSQNHKNRPLHSLHKNPSSIK